MQTIVPHTVRLSLAIGLWEIQDEGFRELTVGLHLRAICWLITLGLFILEEDGEQAWGKMVCHWLKRVVA